VQEGKIDRLNPQMFMTQSPAMKDALTRGPYGKKQKYLLIGNHNNQTKETQQSSNRTQMRDSLQDNSIVMQE
jgi:hypothetical protein